MSKIDKTTIIIFLFSVRSTIAVFKKTHAFKKTGGKKTWKKADYTKGAQTKR